MPTITPQPRASIGGSEEASVSRRVQMTASTGMQVSKPTAPPAAPAAAESAQPGTSEETPAQAATLSPQLTALARKQQKLQQEIQAQRERESGWEREKADYVPRSQIKDGLLKKPLDILKDHGVSYEEFNAAVLAQLNGADPVQELRSEIEGLKRSQEESTNKQYDATLKQYRAEADALVAKDPKAFFFITKGEHQDAVVQHIVDTWKENPDEVLTVEQAAKEVESILRENARAAADRLKELEPPAEVPATTQKKTLPPPQAAAAPRTLTQRAEAAPPARVFGQTQHLSMQERIAQAVARAQR